MLLLTMAGKTAALETWPFMSSVTSWGREEIQTVNFEEGGGVVRAPRERTPHARKAQPLRPTSAHLKDHGLVRHGEDGRDVGEREGFLKVGGRN